MQSDAQFSQISWWTHFSCRSFLCLGPAPRCVFILWMFLGALEFLGVRQCDVDDGWLLPVFHMDIPTLLPNCATRNLGWNFTSMCVICRLRSTSSGGGGGGGGAHGPHSRACGFHSADGVGVTWPFGSQSFSRGIRGEASCPLTVRKDCVVAESVNPYLMVNSMPRLAHRDGLGTAIHISE